MYNRYELNYFRETVKRHVVDNAPDTRRRRELITVGSYLQLFLPVVREETDVRKLFGLFRRRWTAESSVIEKKKKSLIETNKRFFIIIYIYNNNKYYSMCDTVIGE